MSDKIKTGDLVCHTKGHREGIALIVSLFTHRRIDTGAGIPAARVIWTHRPGIHTHFTKNLRRLR